MPPEREESISPKLAVVPPLAYKRRLVRWDTRGLLVEPRSR